MCGKKKMKSVSYFLLLFSKRQKENETVVTLDFDNSPIFFQTGLSTVRALYPKGAKQRPNDCLDTTNYKQKQSKYQSKTSPKNNKKSKQIVFCPLLLLSSNARLERTFVQDLQMVKAKRQIFVLLLQQCRSQIVQNKTNLAP